MTNLNLLKCSQCGGDITRDENMRVYKCSWCGSIFNTNPSDACLDGYKWLEAEIYPQAQKTFLHAVTENPFDVEAWVGGFKAATWNLNAEKIANLCIMEQNTRRDLRKELLPDVDLHDVIGHPLAFWVIGGQVMNVFEPEHLYMVFYFAADVFSRIVPDWYDDEASSIDNLDLIASSFPTNTVQSEVGDSAIIAMSLPVWWASGFKDRYYEIYGRH